MNEPVEYQYRTRPDWIPEWNGWNTCSKDSAEAYEKTPYLHDWHYEVRRLYTSPPAQQEPTESVLIDGVAYVIPAAVAYELLHLHLQIEASRTEEQEPVAWIDEYGNAFPLAAKQYSVVGKYWKPLYTSPPAQRRWVGLTDEEIKALASWWPSYDQMPALMVLAKDIQNSLKEKNT